MTRRLVLAMAVLLGLSACGGSETRLSKGDEAPGFELATLAGPPMRFPRDTAGRAVIVRFWAGWCPHCEKEMKAIDPVASRLAGEGVSLLAVNVGQDRAAVQAFVDRVGFRYPALIDEPAATAKLYGVKGLPTTFFIRPDGRVESRLVGEVDVATFERLARQLVEAGGARR